MDSATTDTEADTSGGTTTDTVTRPAYQARVNEERAALGEKIEKLDVFVASDAFHDLLEQDRIDLMDQRTAMYSYAAILDRRIARF